MDSQEIVFARGKLGAMWGLNRPLHAAELGRVLGLTGRDPGRPVIAWEKGFSEVSGPVALAIELMLSGGRPNGLDQILRLRQEDVPA